MSRVSVLLAAMIITPIHLSTANGAGPPSAPDLRLIVQADENDRLLTPISVPLPEGWSNDGWFVILVDKVSRESFFAQLNPDTQTLSCVLPKVSAGSGERVFELRSTVDAVSIPVYTERNDSTLLIADDRRPLLEYHHAPLPAPEGANPLYARSAFIHPLRSPSGQVLTQIRPEDHLHHMGLWMPWTHTEIGGRAVDFWNLPAGQGTVRFVEFTNITTGPVWGGFQAVQEHIDLKAPGVETVAIRENLDVRVWKTGDKPNPHYILDYTSRQTCVSEVPIEFPHYRYGGFGFRGTERWNQTNSNYLTSEGKTRKDGHATRSRWCMVYGTTEEGPAGVLFMSHPENHEHPEPMRIWPDNDGVFFNYCPVQKTDWRFEPGGEYVFRYRLYVYDGTLTPEDAERLWTDFAHPPMVRIEEVVNQERAE